MKQSINGRAKIVSKEEKHFIDLSIDKNMSLKNFKKIDFLLFYK